MLAAQAIASGMASTVVCYYGVDWGSSAGGPYQFHGADPYKTNPEMPFGFYGQPIYLAPVIRRYAHQYGLTEEELAGVAISTRAWAALHPGAMKRTPLTLDDYRASPMLTDPIWVLECCLFTDGVATYVITSTERAPGPAAQASQGQRGVVQLIAGVQPLLPVPARGLPVHPGCGDRPRALGMAWVTPRDMDFVEIYDCFTISRLLQAEDLGFAPKGAGASLFADGRPAPIGPAPGGSLPINTHGGLRQGETVLDALRLLGYGYRVGCRRGGCGICKADPRSGRVARPRNPEATTHRFTTHRRLTMPVMRVGYVHPRATDIEQARAHYGQTLGMRLVAEHDGALYVKPSDECDHHGVVVEPGRVGLVKLGYKDARSDDLDRYEHRAQPFGGLTERTSRGTTWPSGRACGSCCRPST